MKTFKYLIVVLVAFMFSSCKKEGCTDKGAVNFCKDCKKDDNSCLFKSNSLMWYDTITRDSLLTHNIKTLKYYVHDPNNNATLRYYANVLKRILYSAPACDDYGIFDLYYLVKKDEVISKYYMITDTFDNKIWEGYHEFRKENPCMITQKKWKE